MPHRDWKLRISDILKAIRNVRTYTEGMSYNDFISDRKTVDAVIRNFIIIGEAANRIPNEVESMHPEIPWKDMRDMRNFVVHEYFGISDKIIWDTIQNDLPPLIQFLDNVMQSGN